MRINKLRAEKAQDHANDCCEEMAFLNKNSIGCFRRMRNTHEQLTYKVCQLQKHTIGYHISWSWSTWYKNRPGPTSGLQPSLQNRRRRRWSTVISPKKLYDFQDRLTICLKTRNTDKMISMFFREKCHFNQQKAEQNKSFGESSRPDTTSGPPTIQPTWFTFKSMLKFCRPCFGMSGLVPRPKLQSQLFRGLHSMGFTFGNIIWVKLFEDILHRIITSQFHIYANICQHKMGHAWTCYLHAVTENSWPGDWKGPYPNREHLRGCFAVSAEATRNSSNTSLEGNQNMKTWSRGISSQLDPDLNPPNCKTTMFQAECLPIQRYSRWGQASSSCFCIPKDNVNHLL